MHVGGKVDDGQWLLLRIRLLCPWLLLRRTLSIDTGCLRIQHQVSLSDSTEILEALRVTVFSIFLRRRDHGRTVVWLAGDATATRRHFELC